MKLRSQRPRRLTARGSRLAGFGIFTIMIATTLPAMIAHGYAIENALWWTSDGSYVSGPNYNPKQCGGRVSFYNGGTTLQTCTITISESNLYTAPSAYDQVAKAAASDWNNAINGSKTFYYYSVGGSGGPVTITSADLGGPNSNGVTTIGLARYSYWNNPPLNEMASGDTITTTTNSSITFCLSGCPVAGQLTLQQDVEHEMGHILGLAHPTNGPNSGVVMQCLQAYGVWERLSSDDINGAEYLYSDSWQNYGSPSSSPC